MTADQAFNQAKLELANRFENILNDSADFVIEKFQDNIDNADNIYKKSIFPPTLLKSGDLRNSFYKNKIDSTTIDVKNDTLYGIIQNFGGRIPITEKMRKFFWTKFYSTGMVEYKHMALTKKSHIDIPERNFIYIDEQELTNYIYQKLANDFSNI